MEWLQDLLPKLYSLMLKHKFTPERQKRFTLIDSKAVQLVSEIVKPSKNDTICLFYDGPCFLADSLKKSKLVLVEEEPFTSMLSKEFTGIEVRNARGFHIPKGCKVVLSDFKKFSDEEWCEALSKAKTVTVTCSDDDYFKLTAEPVLVDYSPLTVATQTLAFIEEEVTLQQNDFHPRPPSPRKVLRFKTVAKNPVKGRELEFLAFLKKVFKYKNKNAAKALRLSLPEMPEPKARKLVEGLGLDEAKVFQVEVDEFVDLFNSLPLK